MPETNTALQSNGSARAKSAVPLCITGMHRSGTSLTTSWFARCGLYVGDDLGPANQSNPKGHFEDQEFVLFQANAVCRYYPQSFGWKVTEPRFIRFNETEAQQARDFVEERSADHQFWGWKDPRSVLFLEHWREISPEARFFLVWRNCIDVVESLVKRAKAQNIELTRVSLAQSVRIWAAYNRLTADFKKRFPHESVLVKAQTIQSQPEKTFALLQEKLGVELKYEPFDSVLDKNIWHEKKEPGLQLKLLFAMFGVHSLEQELAALADVRP